MLPWQDIGEKLSRSRDLARSFRRVFASTYDNYIILILFLIFHMKITQLPVFILDFNLFLFRETRIKFSRLNSM